MLSLLANEKVESGASARTSVSPGLLGAGNVSAPVRNSNGFEFAAHVRRNDKWRSIPIVVMTAYALSTLDLLRLNGFVEKILPTEGVASEALLDQVRELLRECTTQTQVGDIKLEAGVQHIAAH